MPTQRDLSLLLDDLCSSLGICLAPEQRAALVSTVPATAGAFVEAVVRAEGLALRALDARLARQIESKVAVTFARDHVDDA